MEGSKKKISMAVDWWFYDESTPDPDNWILSEGVWNDEGEWNDEATWNDESP